MARGGKTKDRTPAPERRCIATGEVQPTDRLIRFVVGPGDVIVADLLGKLPGRGIWVTADRAALDKAVAKNLFARAARQPVTVPPDLVAQIETALVDRTVNLIALARKAGEAVAGYEKVKGWLATDQARVLIQASDGSERGKTKLRAPPGNDRFIGCLKANELGLAFGRENVIHGALAGGGLTRRVVEEAAKLHGFRENDDGTARRKGTKSNERY
jgi:predicted RNA-binding protein YlxR (DUF448 family)